MRPATSAWSTRSASDRIRVRYGARAEEGDSASAIGNSRGIQLALLAVCPVHDVRRRKDSTSIDTVMPWSTGIPVESSGPGAARGPGAPVQGPRVRKNVARQHAAVMPRRCRRRPWRTC